MRALLDLMRENEASAQISFAGCEMVLETAGEVLTILDPGVGQEELIQAVAAAQAKLRTP